MGAYWRIVVCLVAVTGCAGDLRQPERFAACPPGLVEDELLVSKCASAACHDSEKPASALDLVSPGVRARLADTPSEICADRTLIDTSDPGISFMLEKLYPQPECGAQMPHGGLTLSSEERECMRRWIVSGEVAQ